MANGRKVPLGLSSDVLQRMATFNLGNSSYVGTSRLSAMAGEASIILDTGMLERQKSGSDRTVDGCEQCKFRRG